ncbi:MAG: GspH/FimT family pseudopilin [Burkholderiales bacterium]|jgi:type IV fimbrial biogenesis protein FimT|nr:GspH/FimT family pseudopilin [Burkholderiales bacterium]
MNRPSRPSRRTVPLPRRADGFSLIELMFTITLAGILAAVAVPSMSKMFKTNRVQTEASSFVGDLMLARTEAVKRGQNVSVCVSTDGVNCLTTNTWNQGWIVFPDSTAACSAATTAAPAVKVRKAFSTTDTLVASVSKSCVTFNREGFTSNLGTASVTFTLHTADSLGSATRCVAVDLGGRITTQTAGQASTSCS